MEFSNSSMRNMQGVDPDMVLVFITALANSPIDPLKKPVKGFLFYHFISV